MPSIPDDPITFTCTLEARRQTVYFLAKLIHEHCERAGTRRGTRVLGPFRHAVMVLRWFLAASAAGITHLNLDGTLIHTDRVAMKGPNGADLWWSGKHKHHGGNIQVISDPTGYPIWVSGVRPGRRTRHHLREGCSRRPSRP